MTKIREQVSNILGFTIMPDEWDKSFEELDREDYQEAPHKIHPIASEIRGKPRKCITLHRYSTHLIKM